MYTFKGNIHIEGGEKIQSRCNYLYVITSTPNCTCNLIETFLL